MVAMVILLITFYYTRSDKNVVLLQKLINNCVYWLIDEVCGVISGDTGFYHKNSGIKPVFMRILIM